MVPADPHMLFHEGGCWELMWTWSCCGASHRQELRQVKAGSHAALARSAAAFDPAQCSAGGCPGGKGSAWTGHSSHLRGAVPCDPGQVGRGQPPDSKDFAAPSQASVPTAQPEHIPVTGVEKPTVSSCLLTTLLTPQGVSDTSQ